MASQRGLTVRGFERQLIELPVEFIVADEHRAQVRFSTTSIAPNQTMAAGVTFDLSVGGLGFKSSQFLPRNCEGTIHVMSPKDLPTEGEAGKQAAFDQSCVRIAHRVKVRRVWMNDSDASYCVGLAFVNPTPMLEETVNELLAEVERHRTERARAEKGVVNDA